MKKEEGDWWREGRREMERGKGADGKDGVERVGKLMGGEGGDEKEEAGLMERLVR